MNKKIKYIISCISVLLCVSSLTNFNANEFMNNADKLEIFKNYNQQKYTMSLGDVEVRKDLITNNYKPRGTQPKYIVIHATGNRKSDANAKKHKDYYQTNTRGASAHYTVDDHEIVQTVEDTNTAYHCQDTYNKQINNSNSIAIEMCMNDGSNPKKIREHTVTLTKYLMKKHGIPVEKVVRHFDVTGKKCPEIMVDGYANEWYAFRKQIGYEDKKEELTTSRHVRIIKEAELKATPSWLGETVSTLNLLEEYEVVGEEGNWLHIKYSEDTLGFIESSNAVTVEEPQVKVVKSLALISSKMDLNDSAVTVVKEKEKVNLYAVIGNWALVSYNETIGYMPTIYIN